MKFWSRLTFVLVAVILILQSSLSAKLPTVKVTVAGPGLTSDLALSDRQVLVNVWTGLPDKEGFFDFPRPFIGEVVGPPARTLPRFTVAFFAVDPSTNQQRVFYRVQYVPDRSSQAGYVYLPGRNEPDGRLNESTIVRPQDGNWTRASTSWSAALNGHLPLQPAR